MIIIIQVVGVAFIIEFCDHNNNYKSYFNFNAYLCEERIHDEIGRIRSVKPDYWGACQRVLLLLMK